MHKRKMAKFNVMEIFSENIEVLENLPPKTDLIC
jgi:hypothetical protein